MPGPPNKIMLIRHGEKQENGGPIGVREDGTSDKHSLIVRGWQRAGALTPFFAKPARVGIATPATLFAAATSDDATIPDDEAKSLRPQETILTLGRKLAVAPNVTIAVGQEATLIPALRACDGVVLVAWEHNHIPIIAAGFVQDPPAWGDRFDAVWVLDRQPDGTYQLSIVNQDLLDGDVPA
jgi:hypothetical protein